MPERDDRDNRGGNQDRPAGNQGNPGTPGNPDNRSGNPGSRNPANPGRSPNPSPADRAGGGEESARSPERDDRANRSSTGGAPNAGRGSNMDRDKE